MYSYEFFKIHFWTKVPKYSVPFILEISHVSDRLEPALSGSAKLFEVYISQIGPQVHILVSRDF